MYLIIATLKLFFIRITKYRKFDSVLFLGYETLPFYIAHFFSKKTIFLINHNNIDELKKSYLKRLFFRLKKTNLTHLVLHPSIKTYLSKNYTSNVTSISHPINSSPYKDNVIKSDYILCLSSTNDKDKLIHYFSNFRSNKYTLFTKAKFLRGPKVIYKEFFDDYNSLVEKAKFAAVFNLFEYRVSGVMFDALSRGCIVLCEGNPITHDLKSRYPSLIYIVKNRDELYSLIEKEDLYADSNDVIKFQNDHRIKIDV